MGRKNAFGAAVGTIRIESRNLYKILFIGTYYDLLLKLMAVPHAILRVFVVPHAILRVFNTILYENEFQNPQFFYHTVRFSTHPVRPLLKYFNSVIEKLAHICI
jgi:hypothetical protein